MAAVDVAMPDLIVNGAEPESKKQSANDQAAAHKATGNKLYSEKKFKEALGEYSEAIRLDPTNDVYLSNRSAAYMQIYDYRKMPFLSKFDIGELILE